LRVIKKPWSSEEEITDLQSFDIGIMPLSDDPWSRGKCALKIIQYFGVGVPVVCSPVGMNRDIVEDGVNGFWASKEGEWEDRLVRLVEAKDLRREMGLRGRRTVERGYTVEVNGPRILNILRQVVGA
jgi:glycosyltransferase involved in cell wall biosynthesis